MSEWKKIESAPKDGSEVLVCYKFGKQQEQIVSHAVVLWDICHEKWRITHDCCIPKSAIIGWMPLPEPPKKKHLCLQGCVAVHNCNGYLAMDVYEDSDRKGCFTPHIIKCCPFCGEPE